VLAAEVALAEAAVAYYALSCLLAVFEVATDLLRCAAAER